jgi:transposase-like protein
MVRRVVNDGLSKAAAARQFNTTPKTVAKWVVRFRARPAIGNAQQVPAQTITGKYRISNQPAFPVTWPAQ